MATRGKDNVRYLQPINVESGNQKKYCRFKKSGIKFIDYKDPWIKFISYSDLHIRREMAKAVKWFESS